MTSHVSTSGISARSRPTEGQQVLRSAHDERSETADLLDVAVANEIVVLEQAVTLAAERLPPLVIRHGVRPHTSMSSG